MACALGNSPVRTASYGSMRGCGRRHRGAVYHPAEPVYGASKTRGLLPFVERQLRVTQRLDPRHPGKVTGDSLTIVALSMVSNIRTDSSGLISTPTSSRVVVRMLGMPMASPC
jgi:hypothetical protein